MTNKGEMLYIPAKLQVTVDKEMAHEVAISIPSSFEHVVVRAFEGLGLDVGTDADYGRPGYTVVILRDRYWDQEMEPSYTRTLEIVAKVPEGMGWAISEEDGMRILKDFALTLTTDMERAGGPMTSGNKGAKFEYRGMIFRVEREWTGKWKLYKGIWKPDPHWTGD